MNWLADVLWDAAVDSVKLLPFLFITYLVMEYLENKMEEKSHRVIAGAGKTGPLFGGILGVFPQCGFSAAASNLYAGGVITAGTLVAVFLSTSDEMLPVLISEAVAWDVIGKILLTKVVLAVISGFALDGIFHAIPYFHRKDKHIHDLCEQEHCEPEKGIFHAALWHTIKIAFFIFVISLLIDALIEGVGEERLAQVLTNRPITGQLLAGLMGLIPNCASSVLITQMYLDGILGMGAMMTGLLVGAGVGLLVLFRMNKSLRENMNILAALYVIGVFWGIVIEFVGIDYLRF